MDTALPGKECGRQWLRITPLYLHENFIRIAFQIDPGLARGDLPLESKFLVWFPEHQAQRGISEVSRL